MDVSEKRFSDIELAIKELTILNKNQEINANRQADAIDKILEHLQGMAVLEHVVDGNIEDINKLGNKIDDIYSKMSAKESEMHREITANREDLKALGIDRQIKSIVYSAIITTFLFGYLYLDFHRAEKEIRITFSAMSAELKQNSANLFHAQETLKEHKILIKEEDVKIDHLMHPKANYDPGF